jgi:hypothetical protein
LAGLILQDAGATLLHFTSPSKLDAKSLARFSGTPARVPVIESKLSLLTAEGEFCCAPLEGDWLAGAVKLLGVGCAAGIVRLLGGGGAAGIVKLLGAGGAAGIVKLLGVGGAADIVKLLGGGGAADIVKLLGGGSAVRTVSKICCVPPGI